MKITSPLFDIQETAKLSGVSVNEIRSVLSAKLIEPIDRQRFGRGQPRILFSIEQVIEMATIIYLHRVGFREPAAKNLIQKSKKERF